MDVDSIMNDAPEVEEKKLEFGDGTFMHNYTKGVFNSPLLMSWLVENLMRVINPDKGFEDDTNIRVCSLIASWKLRFNMTLPTRQNPNGLVKRKIDEIAIYDCLESIKNKLLKKDAVFERLDKRSAVAHVLKFLSEPYQVAFKASLHMIDPKFFETPVAVKIIVNSVGGRRKKGMKEIPVKRSRRQEREEQEEDEDDEDDTKGGEQEPSDEEMGELFDNSQPK